MATNNTSNIKSTGIVSYNGTGTFSGLAIPLTVTNGGTGASSLVAYSVLTGGTSATAAVQSVASVGTAAQALTSNGAAALPTFQTAPTGTGFVFFRSNANNVGPLDSTTYYIGDNWSTVAGIAENRMYIPAAGTITRVFGALTLGGTGSSENVTIFYKLNGTTTTNISTTSQWNASVVTFSNIALSTSVSAGDYIEFGFTTPAWVTNPTNIDLTVSIFMG